MARLAAGFAAGFFAQALWPGLFRPVGGRRTRTVMAVLSGPIPQPAHLLLKLEGIIGQSPWVAPTPAPQLFQALMDRVGGVHRIVMGKGICPSPEHEPRCLGGADSGASVRWFGPRESNWLPGNRCPGNGPVAQRSPASRSDGGNVVASRRRSVGQSGKDVVGQQALGPKAIAETDCCWQPTTSPERFAQLTTNPQIAGSTLPGGRAKEQQARSTPAQLFTK